MRGSIAYLARRGHFHLSPGELIVLEEKRYRPRGGEVVESNSYNDTLENLFLAFRYFPAAFGAEYSLAKSDARWQAFTRSLTLRNQLTHPKKPQDLDLTAESIREFADAFRWFTEQVVASYTAILGRLNDASKTGEQIIRRQEVQLSNGILPTAAADPKD